MAFAISYEDGHTILRVDGVLDGEVAVKLMALLLAEPGSSAGPIIIDLFKARDISPIALAALLDAGNVQSMRVRFRGLAARHNRILQLLSAGTYATRSRKVESDSDPA